MRRYFWDCFFCGVQNVGFVVNDTYTHNAVCIGCSRLNVITKIKGYDDREAS